MATTRLTLQGKVANERNQRVFAELLRDPNNAICADCRSPGPCWASYNLGIFLCMRCAGIHRKLGTHITKVKSLTLDSWTTEQMENLKKHGNKHVNAYFNPQPERHPIPHGEKEMEKYIRDKYERKAFMNRETLQRKPQVESPRLSSQQSSLLAKLRELGFTDNSRNEQALAKTNNNLEMAIHLLNSASTQPAPHSTLARSMTYSEGTMQQPSTYQRPVPLRRSTTTQPIPDVLNPNMFESRGSPLTNQAIGMNTVPQQQSFSQTPYANTNQFTNSPVAQGLLYHNGSPQQFQSHNQPNASFGSQSGYYSSQPMYTNTMQSQPQPDQFKHQINKDYIMSLYNPSPGPSYNRTQEPIMSAPQQFNNFNSSVNPQQPNGGGPQYAGNQGMPNNGFPLHPSSSQQSGDWWN